MEKKTDLRVIKTKRAIRDAFLRLMDAKGLSAMTVQDILEEALINRKTFYTYYRDKYDLAEQVANGFLAEFDAILAERFPEGRLDQSAFAALEKIYEEMHQHKKEVRAIWRIRTERVDVLESLHARLQQVYQNLAESCGAAGDVRLQSYLFSTFVLTSYQHIMETEQPYQAHQLWNEFQQLCDVLERASRPNAAQQARQSPRQAAEAPGQKP